jgi:ABC-type antimicrobial peptide transport system permease subunit
MIQHYLKIAFRNMWKYKTQTLVSVAGLAVGFVCFAMATLWVRYEMTYDSFHKNADRLYCVSIHNTWSLSKSDRLYIPFPLAGYLKSTFPEIANVVAISPGDFNFEYEGVNHKANSFGIDSSFLNVFDDVKIVEGSMDFLIPESNKAAITREKALQLFGNESPIGKKLGRDSYYYEISAVVTGFHGRRSNYPFDFLHGISTNIQISPGDGRVWYNNGQVIVEVVPGIDMEAFEKKLSKSKFQQSHVSTVENITLTPLTAVHYQKPSIQRNVKFQHIIIFVFAGLFLILCTLVNYFTLFVSRFRIRRRELALRTVYGASMWSLFTMLSVEFLMSLIASLISGLVLLNILHSSFLKVSGIQLELSAIYLESIIYITGIVAVALTAFFLMLMIFRRRTLNANIRDNRKILRKASIVVQLIVSILFAFCTLVILKQMHHLHNSDDLGFSFKNRGSIFPLDEKTQTIMGEVLDKKLIEALNDKMRQIPEIKETITESYSLLPRVLRGTSVITDWDGKQGDATINIDDEVVSERYIKFYELKLIEGEFYRDDDDSKYVLINELAAEAFGWNKATGKSFTDDRGIRYEVKGVIKNIYKFAPTYAHKPSFYHHRSDQVAVILFKYNEGSEKICLEKIKKIIEKDFPGLYYEYHNLEKEYDKYLRSENALFAILTTVSLVCLIVCIFGFVSMVSLTCEERRKEIAIRKINGATIKDILDIFFKEYLTLLAIGALIAFPIGYVIMKPWVEQYVLQTEISAWIYLSILFALIMVIVMCVGRRVYKTSRENPINAIK